MTAIIFSIISVLAITAGGLTSAFSAQRPSRQTAWTSAYLVLVAGIIQLGLVAAWRALGRPEPTSASLALLLFNLGNGGVVAGTLLKKQLQKYYRRLVDAGGVCIAAAMALLLFAVRKSPMSWIYLAFVALAVIILVSMPVGLVLSRRRHKQTEKNE